MSEHTPDPVPDDLAGVKIAVVRWSIEGALAEATGPGGRFLCAAAGRSPASAMRLCAEKARTILRARPAGE